jgi:hypothetical protein
MSNRVDLSDTKVKEAIDSVITSTPEDDKKNPWVLLTHVGQTNKLKVAETGDTFNEFIDELNDGKLMYGLMKFNLNGVYKTAFISWCPDGVDGVMKGKFSVWNKDLEFTWKGKYHTQVMARRAKDIDRNQMIQKMKVATGSSYAHMGGRVVQTVDTAKQNIDKQKQESMNRVERVDKDYQNEQLKQKSNAFWSKQQEQSEQRQTTGNQTRKEIEQLSQKRNEYWSKEQPAIPPTAATTTNGASSSSSSSSSSKGTGGVKQELNQLKEKSDAFWRQQKQEQDSSSTAKTSRTRTVIKADVSGLRNKFAEQARISSEATRSAPAPAVHVGGTSVKSVRDRFAEQQQQNNELLPPPPPPLSSSSSSVHNNKPVVTNARLPPPPPTTATTSYNSSSSSSMVNREEEEEQQQQEQPYEEEEQYHDQQQQQQEEEEEEQPTTQQESSYYYHQREEEEEEEQQQQQQQEKEEEQYEQPAAQEEWLEQQEQPVHNDGLMRYRAMYDFEAGEAEELSFFEGDILIVVDANGDWWKAYREADITQHAGYVPANYIEPV